MKILFVISSLTSGGAQRVLITLSNYWIEKGWDITILSILSDDKSFYIINPNIKVIYLDKKYNNNILNILWYLYGIRKTIKSNNPMIVIPFISSINIFTLISSIGLKKTILISERNSFDSLTSKVWRSLRRIFYPLSDGLVVLSKYDYSKYTYVKSKKIIFNPLNIDTILESKFQMKERVIIAVGSLTEQKGFDRLIKLLTRIDLTGWKVLIIGEGSKRKELTELIQEFKLEDKIFLVGRKSNIYDYYKRASIFVLSSYWEGFPNVLLEAMAHGCSCIAFDCKTGPSEIIEDGINGYLVEDNNSKLFRDRLVELMNNKDIREVFFTNSLKTRDIFHINKIAKEWEDYINLVKRKK